MTYVRSSAGAGLSHTDVTDDMGNVSQYDFVLPSNVTNRGSALLYSTRVATFQGAASGTALRLVENCYAGSRPCTTTPISLPITSIATYTTLNGVEQNLIGTGFDSYSGAITARNVTDYGTTIPSTYLLFRSTPVQTLSNGIVVPLRDKANLNGSLAASIFDVEYFYDETAPATSAGVPMHTAVTGPRGNLTFTYVSSDSTHSLHTTFSYEDTGTLISSTDPINGSTNFGYDGTFTYQTSATPPTPSSGANLSIGAAYDTTRTSLQNAASDPNATTSISSFDAILRPRVVSYPDGGATNLVYTPTQTSRFRTMSAGTEDSETLLDARTRRTAIANGQGGQGWYVQDTCYDSNSRIGFKSYPYQAASLTGSSVCSGAGGTYT